MNEDVLSEPCSSERAANWTPAIHPSVLVAKVCTSPRDRSRPCWCMRALTSSSSRPEVRVPDLGQSPSGPPPLDWQYGIDAGREHDMGRRRESFDKGAKPPEVGRERRRADRRG